MPAVRLGLTALSMIIVILPAFFFFVWRPAAKFSPPSHLANEFTLPPFTDPGFNAPMAQCARGPTRLVHSLLL
jgi:hypothetical protein